jgi:hypothetical protein
MGGAFCVTLNTNWKSWSPSQTADVSVAMKTQLANPLIDNCQLLLHDSATVSAPLHPIPLCDQYNEPSKAREASLLKPQVLPPVPDVNFAVRTSGTYLVGQQTVKTPPALLGLESGPDMAVPQR